MNRSQPETLLQERRAIRALTLAGLIRLITEIDDNGPISHRRGSLQGAFGDLTPGQLRHAIDVARDLGLVHADEQAPDRYRLTASGEALAEVYDTAARWARARHFPDTNSGFVTRVQHTLQLHSRSPQANGSSLEPSAPHQVLTEFLQSNPRVLHHADVRSPQPPAEAGLAA
ncbi:hypothetical protein [Streptomyces himalayensis]|uniref:HTH hxlR-type domain-containing protein n=1 Tax=Streptomyces himalayensis subsp. himalayensis TaxID=2756131 RepID=A0A7W0DT59_9ACTN|nr:hypothetical protein [Streptomyces himalayensis]MBA2950293.1 hypothetical protein [Streptomyces himalayensis subsp. himalayensis]